jgi:hypothetical protein
MEATNYQYMWLHAAAKLALAKKTYMRTIIAQFIADNRTLKPYKYVHIVTNKHKAFTRA